MATADLSDFLNPASNPKGCDTLRRKSALTTAAAGLTLAMALAACAGSPTQTPGQGQSAPAATGATAGGTEVADAAVGKIYNPSDKKGGTLKMANTADWDSLDPGNTYYGYSLNFARLYGRALLMFKAAPGTDGNTLVPDLAESVGKASDDAKTWTYKLRKGVKFEDGTEVTSKDVAYAVARQFDKEIHPNGPTYLNALLDWPKGYKGAYKSKDADFSSAVETPDDQTIIFHLKEPFGLFDYIMQMPMTMPVPKDKDTGTKYQEHVISTGPYKFEKNEIGKGFTLVRNDQWDPATDPNRPALPDRIEVQTGVNADDVDNRLISGDVHIAVDGLGIGNAALPKVLPDPALKARTDNPVQQRTWYTSIIPDVAPLDNVECRRAIAFAADRNSLYRAYGGETGGVITTSLIPPSMAGYKPIDLYKSEGDKGDVEKAKAAPRQVRPAQRLRDQHRLPHRADQGEGRCRVAAAVAGPRRHQADAQAVPAGRLLRPVRRQALLRQGEQDRPGDQRLGLGLPRHLRLHAGHHRQPGHP
ncbi:hypothetical protein GCM10020219_008120 [Nonomuraea dietziae]